MNNKKKTYDLLRITSGGRNFPFPSKCNTRPKNENARIKTLYSSDSFSCRAPIEKQNVRSPYCCTQIVDYKNHRPFLPSVDCGHCLHFIFSRLPRFCWMATECTVRKKRAAFFYRTTLHSPHFYLFHSLRLVLPVL
jgi:hypothetical protein